MTQGETVYRNVALEAIVEAISSNERWAGAKVAELIEEAERYLKAAEYRPPKVDKS